MGGKSFLPPLHPAPATPCHFFPFFSTLRSLLWPCLCKGVCVCVCVCVYAIKRERESEQEALTEILGKRTEKDRNRGTAWQRQQGKICVRAACVWLCVRACVRQRKRERESKAVASLITNLVSYLRTLQHSQITTLSCDNIEPKTYAHITEITIHTSKTIQIHTERVTYTHETTTRKLHSIQKSAECKNNTHVHVQ